MSRIVSRSRSGFHIRSLTDAKSSTRYFDSSLALATPPSRRALAMRVFSSDLSVYFCLAVILFVLSCYFSLFFANVRASETRGSLHRKSLQLLFLLPADSFI